MKFHFAGIALLVVIFKMSAQETSINYTTFEKSGEYTIKREGLSETPKVDAIEKRREALPVNDFPEGNWGQPFRGFQLSLRFNKDTYTNGETITAILLVRNITNSSMGFYYASEAANNDGPFELLVTTDKGQTVTAPPINYFTATSGGGEIYTNAQYKYLERLNNRYNLTNGTYLVQASFGYQLVKKRSPEGKPIELEWKKITSAPVQIKIKN
jgi:hypothetical protein